MLPRGAARRWVNPLRSLSRSYKSSTTATSTVKFDFRSDTLTRPTEAMMEDMMTAPVGDDVYGEDPTVSELEEQVANLVGKESAVFVATGTMSNQLGLRTQLNALDSLILDARSHVYKYETGGIAAHSGASLQPLHPSDGKSHLTKDVVEANVQLDHDLYHCPVTKAISLENTLMGTVHDFDEMEEISVFGRSKGLWMHLDGARLWNASVASGHSMSEYGRLFDSISVCLSKGLGAPVGSVLAADAKTCDRVKWFRKMYGGGWRQAGLLAAAGIHAINNIFPILHLDHQRAQQLADGLRKLGFEITVPVDTNMVYCNSEKIGKSMEDFGQELAKVGIMTAPGGYTCRLVLHHQTSDEGVEYFLEQMARLV